MTFKDYFTLNKLIIILFLVLFIGSGYMPYYFTSNVSEARPQIGYPLKIYQYGCYPQCTNPGPGNCCPQNFYILNLLLDVMIWAVISLGVNAAYIGVKNSTN